MRPRTIVAVAALIAAAALVALPGPAGPQGQNATAALAADAFQRLPLVAPAGPTSATTSFLDPAGRSFGALGPETALSEPAGRSYPRARPAAAQPAARLGFVAIPVWHWDPEASFYGPGFYGHRTACGVAYTTSILGVAHRTLPCGTRVSFRNPANGRIITVPVIDRGPYVSGRMWDLSAAACLALDHCYTGPIEWRLPRS